MLAFLESIGNFIGSIVGFLVSFFQGMIRLVKYIGIAIDTIAQVTIFLPGDLAILAGAFVAVAVVYLLIGREG